MAKNKLREIMFFKDITQNDLEKLTGIGQSELSRIINDKKSGLQLRTAQKIAKALGVKVDDIWHIDWFDDK